MLCKVVTMGEHSGGYVGYGDVRSEIIPCGKFVLRTTRKKWKKKSKYEFNGIPPMVLLGKESDWVQAAARYLANKNTN